MSDDAMSKLRIAAAAATEANRQLEQAVAALGDGIQRSIVQQLHVHYPTPESPAEWIRKAVHRPDGR